MYRYSAKILKRKTWKFAHSKVNVARELDIKWNKPVIKRWKLSVQIVESEKKENFAENSGIAVPGKLETERWNTEFHKSLMGRTS